MKKLTVVSLILFCLSGGLLSPAADFNGDGTNDIGIFRPNTFLWAIRGVTRAYFGGWGDNPVPGDYNGDGTDDIAINRPSSGLWSARGVTRAYFGGMNDITLGGSVGRWLWNGSDIYYNTGKVGIGTPDPRYKLHLHKNSSYFSYLSFTNTSTGSGSADGVLVGIDPNEDFRIHSYESNNIEFWINNSEKVRINSDGDVGIGTNDPAYRLVVDDTRAEGGAAYLLNRSSDSNADGLLIKINRTTPGPSNSFVSCHKANGAMIGAIVGNGSGGVEFWSYGSDFAEYLPRLRPGEAIGSGDIVGIFGGKISKVTDKAEQLLIISTAPIVSGNAPAAGKEHLYEKVAFLGRAPVKVRGPVRAGDYIIPSGLNDGTGRAVSLGELTTAQATRIVGRAWEAAAAEEIKLVDAAVGMQFSAQVLEKINREKEGQITRIQERLKALEENLAKLEAERI